MIDIAFYQKVYIPFYDSSIHQEMCLWIHEDVQRLKMAKKAAACEQSQVCSFLQQQIKKAIKMGTQHTVSANWYTTKPIVLVSVNIRGLILFHDNATVSAQSAQQTIKFYLKIRFSFNIHPIRLIWVCVICGSFLIERYIHSGGRRFTTEDGIDEAILSIIIMYS